MLWCLPRFPQTAMEENSSKTDCALSYKVTLINCSENIILTPKKMLMYVEHGVDNGDKWHNGGVRLCNPGIGTQVLDHSTYATKEGGQNEEREKIDDEDA